MPPLQARPHPASESTQVSQPHATLDTRLASAPSVDLTTPSDTWAGVTSRRHQQPPHTQNNDSFPDVRVWFLWHHNHVFPLATRNSIFDLSSATYAAVEDVGRTKASLLLAPDLASLTPSPLSPDIINCILYLLCHSVHNMYSIRHAQEWLQKAITRSRETRNRNRRAQIDSSASECSVKTRQPRHREDPKNGRGKSKRAITALTTDSDTEPDSPRRSDHDNRHLRKASPRIHHAPDPNNSIAPSFPSRLNQWTK